MFLLGEGACRARAIPQPTNQSRQAGENPAGGSFCSGSHGFTGELLIEQSFTIRMSEGERRFFIHFQGLQQEQYRYLDLHHEKFPY
jgi:hypothetical protein